MVEASDAAGSVTRERILVESSDLFARRGFHGTSTRAIAEAVGIKQPSLFHHFPSKSDVMKALLQLAVEPPRRFAAELAGSAERSPVERLAAVCVALVESAHASPFSLAGVFGDDVLTTPEFDGERGRVEELREAQRVLLRQGVAAGEVLDVDVVLLQRMLEAGVVEAMRRPPTGSSSGSPANADGGSADARLLLTLALRALLVEPGRAPVLVEAASGLTR